METIPIIQSDDMNTVIDWDFLSTLKPRLYFGRRVLVKKIGPISPLWLRVFTKQDEISIAQLAAAYPGKSRKSDVDIESIYALTKIRHDNIQQMFGIVLRPLAIVMEYQDSRRFEIDLDYPTIRYLLLDISMALLYLQSIGMSIPEFTYEDVLIFREPQITAKLSLLQVNWMTKLRDIPSLGSHHQKSMEEEMREIKYPTLLNLNFGTIPSLFPMVSLRDFLGYLVQDIIPRAPPILPAAFFPPPIPLARAPLIPPSSHPDIPPLFHYLLQYIPDSIFDCVLILNHIDPYHECSEMEKSFINALSLQTDEYQAFS